MIEIKNLQVGFGDFLLKNISLGIGQGEYFVIVGPTGAGKTVLLESIAGLHSLRSGEVWLNEREVTHLEPEKRGIGFVYQDLVLFPHLSVRDNIGFGPRLRRQKPGAIVEEMAQLLGISPLLDRKPATLSGGERQKVALARALVTSPQVLLLDEPLSAVDPDTREGLQRELRQIHERLRVTTIHVTHDFQEAVALGDRIAVLGEGLILQVGTPEQVFRHPDSEFVARFALTRNILAGDVGGEEDEHATMSVEGIKLAVVTPLRGRFHASLRPEDILLSTQPLHSSARNSFRGTITDIADRGSLIYVTVMVPPDFTCLVTRRSLEELGLERGKQVYITFKASAIHVF
jgi:molybdopterin-binding protein